VRALTALVEVRGKPLDFPEFVQDDMINIPDHFAPESRDLLTTRHTLEHSLAPLFQLFRPTTDNNGPAIVVTNNPCPPYHLLLRLINVHQIQYRQANQNFG
jgi:hypothetical protein